MSVPATSLTHSQFATFWSHFLIIIYPVLISVVKRPKHFENIWFSLLKCTRVPRWWLSTKSQSALLNRTRISPTFHLCSDCFELVSKNAWPASNICTLNSNHRSVRLAILRGPVHHGAGTVNLFRWRAFRADCGALHRCNRQRTLIGGVTGVHLLSAEKAYCPTMGEHRKQLASSSPE